MKVARTTKERIAQIKAEASTPRSHLEQLLARLEEHSGTKRVCRKLRTAIDKLAEWQREAA